MLVERGVYWGPIKWGVEGGASIYQKEIVSEDQTTQGRYVLIGNGCNWQVRVDKHAGPAATLSLFNPYTTEEKQNLHLEAGCFFILPPSFRGKKVLVMHVA